MHLWKKTSERVNEKGSHWVDLYLTWEYNGKTFCVRIKPQFLKDYGFLLAHAQTLDEPTKTE